MNHYLQYIATDDRARNTVASQFAAAISTVVVCPLDTVKVRFMSQDGTASRTHNGHYYTRIRQGVTCIVREEGVRALYRGGHVAVFGATVSWGTYVFLYRSGQAAMSGYGEGHRFLVDSFVSTTASLTNAMLTSPIWMLKTRMQIDDVAAYQAGVRGHYATFIGGARHVLQSEGALALWKGLRVQLALALMNGFNFPLYEFLKRRVQRLQNRDQLSTPEVIVCSAVAKSALAFGTNPFFVIRTRLQDARYNAVKGVEYTGVASTARITYRREGIGGFFRGVTASIALTAPRTALFMVLLERFDQGLKQLPY
jgi:solute carrier family 25 folate transporter 32